MILVPLQLLLTFGLEHILPWLILDLQNYPPPKIGLAVNKLCNFIRIFLDVLFLSLSAKVTFLSETAKDIAKYFHNCRQIVR